MLFFFNDTATTEIYTLSLHDALPIFAEAQASGKVQTIFAPNLGIADDKGVYPFIPEMIRTYLGEEPILHNAETWSLALEDDLRYVMDHFDELVIKRDRKSVV